MSNSLEHVWHDIWGKYRFETLGLWNFGTHQYISFLRSSPAQELCDLGTLVTLKHLRIQYLWYLGTSGPFKLWHLPKYLGTSAPWYLGTLGLWDLFNYGICHTTTPLVLRDFGTFSILTTLRSKYRRDFGTLGPRDRRDLGTLVTLKH